MENIIEENKLKTGSVILDLASEVPLDLGSAKDLPKEKIDEYYNGTGPDRWPQEVRDKIDELTSFYAPAVVIHDCDFAKSDGSIKGLIVATERFRYNTKMILKHYYPLWCIQWLKDGKYRKTRSKLAALKVAMDIGVSEKFCEQAWKEAHDKYGKEEN